MSLLEQNTITKGRMDENMTKLNIGYNNSRKYQVQAIWDSAINAKEAESGHLPSYYYLVS